MKRTGISIPADDGEMRRMPKSDCIWYTVLGELVLDARLIYFIRLLLLLFFVFCFSVNPGDCYGWPNEM